MPPEPHSPRIISVEGLDQLIKALKQRGYRTVGPTVRSEVIVYDDIASVEDLPRGWTDQQAGGHYRLIRRDDDALFGYAVGPHSFKQFLHPPTERVWRARLDGGRLESEDEPQRHQPLALIGARACEVQAIAIQDTVFIGSTPGDPHYRARRADAFIVAVNCAVAGATCFCASMHTGPRVSAGFDLALTELSFTPPQAFLAEVGTQAGETVLAGITQREATAQEIASARTIVERTAQSMGRTLRTDDLPDLLLRNPEHPRWNSVAERCLTCGNCTMVCPTCFCTSVQDTSDLTGRQITRERRWASCFTLEFSYVHGGSVRHSTRSRYRQWMTHKLATWHAQFGSSGCVGCGRCITWCPVGIDITEEVNAIRESDGA